MMERVETGYQGTPWYYSNGKKGTVMAAAQCVTCDAQLSSGWHPPDMTIAHNKDYKHRQYTPAVRELNVKFREHSCLTQAS